MGNQTIPLHSLGVLLEGFRLVFPNIGLFEPRLKVRTRDPDMISLAPSEMVIENGAVGHNDYTIYRIEMI